ncbi:hypothetical protein ACJIZ3_009261 [Penstemon smallii]|uniref:Uncharacterized protein n=1 Tax=Penstemon smallii TaxID=265156 RepID=A0ABD3TCT9_9LAMI
MVKVTISPDEINVSKCCYQPLPSTSNPAPVQPGPGGPLPLGTAPIPFTLPWIIFFFFPLPSPSPEGCWFWPITFPAMPSLDTVPDVALDGSNVNSSEDINSDDAAMSNIPAFFGPAVSFISIVRFPNSHMLNFSYILVLVQTDDRYVRIRIRVSGHRKQISAIKQQIKMLSVVIKVQ